MEFTPIAVPVERIIADYDQRHAQLLDFAERQAAITRDMAARYAGALPLPPRPNAPSSNIYRSAASYPAFDPFDVNWWVNGA